MVNGKCEEAGRFPFAIYHLPFSIAACPRYTSGRMALEDRDYMNRPMPRTAYRGPRMTSVTLWLIAANVFVYVIDRILLRMGYGIGMDVLNGRREIVAHLVFAPLEY